MSRLDGLELKKNTTNVISMAFRIPVCIKEGFCVPVKIVMSNIMKQ